MDNFAKDFGACFDYSSWFNPERMTTGPSTPPRFSSILKFFTGALAPHVTLHIPWRLHNSPGSLETATVQPENPNPSPSQSPKSDAEKTSMAYLRADPAPFIPRGLNRIEV